MKILRICLTSILVVAFLLYIALPGGVGLYASLGIRKGVGSPPTGFDNVRLTTKDGVHLAAWYAPPKNGAAIILIHGGGSSREGVRSHARMLFRNGFGVLAIDLRGHGMSKGRPNAFGWMSARDIGSAIAFLEQRNVSRIGGMGISLGGEALLGAASEYPSLKAIVSDGATQRSLMDYMAPSSRRSLAWTWTARVLYASVRLFSGNKPPVPIVESLAKATDTRFLLIAGGKVGNEVLYNNLFTKIAGSRAKLWIVPKVGHTQAIRRVPGVYGKRVTDFLESVLVRSGV